MPKKLLKFLHKETTNLRHAGLFRRELRVDSPPGPQVTVESKKVVNLVSDDYLGLSHHPKVISAAKAALDGLGAGASSSRMMAGSSATHLELEKNLTAFLKTEDTLVFASGYHANTGIFEPLFDDRDFIACDVFCHPSLADGIRLSRAKNAVFRNNDVEHLEDQLRRSRAARFRAVVTDGVFPLDGQAAPLTGICALAEKYDAMVVVCDTQGVGVMGPSGRGTHEYRDVLGKVDVLTSSFNGALGGAGGGYASGRQEIIEWLRQKSRPYLMSSALPVASVGAAQAAIELIQEDDSLREQLSYNIARFRSLMEEAGFNLAAGDHPIVPVNVGRAVVAQRLVDYLYRKGIYVAGFCHPVVPEGSARVRVQLTAKHSRGQVERTVRAFQAADEELGLTAEDEDG